MLDSFDNCLAVVIHAPKLDAVALLVGIQKDIGRLEARRDRIADAARLITCFLPTRRSSGIWECPTMIGPPRSQSAVAPFDHRCAWLETGSVVSSWGSMNAEQARAIG